LSTSIFVSLVAETFERKICPAFSPATGRIAVLFVRFGPKWLEIIWMFSPWPAAEKRLLSQLFLCLSRACLGKIGSFLV
jgi:hypothetical protein